MFLNIWNLENHWCLFQIQEVTWHPNMPPTFLLLYATKIEKTVKIDCLLSSSKTSPAETRSNNSGRYTYLDTWILGVASKQLRLLHGGVGDSTIVANFLSPQMSELVEDAIASWCGDIVGHFWLIRNSVEKLVELKFEFSDLTHSMSLRYFGNELYNRGPNTVIAFSWRDCAGFLFVGYWITHSVPCLGCFLFFKIYET